MQRRGRKSVPVGILGEAVHVRAVRLAIIKQTEPVSQDHLAPAGCSCHLSFDGHLPGLGDDPDRLSVRDLEARRIVGMDGQRAGAPAFVPRRVVHGGVCVCARVPACLEKEGIGRIGTKGLCLCLWLEVCDPFGHLGHVDVRLAIFCLNHLKIVAFVRLLAHPGK